MHPLGAGRSPTDELERKTAHDTVYFTPPMKIDQEFILSKDISHLELSFPTFAFATILLCYEIPVLFILLFIGELSVNAQHMFSRQFPFFNQLSSNEIFSIHQDREGYFWIGTTNGLARYDGYQLIHSVQTIKSESAD